MRASFVGLLIAALLMVGCASQNERMTAFGISVPSWVPSGTVEEAYVYALQAPEELAKYTCHCGCDSMGHTNNLQCFVAGTTAEGEPIFDQHGAGCGVCVYTALDVRNMTAQGFSEEEIDAHVDRTYGPGGM